MTFYSTQCAHWLFVAQKKKKKKLRKMQSKERWSHFPLEGNRIEKLLLKIECMFQCEHHILLVNWIVCFYFDKTEKRPTWFCGCFFTLWYCLNVSHMRTFVQMLYNWLCHVIEQSTVDVFNIKIKRDVNNWLDYGYLYSMLVRFALCYTIVDMFCFVFFVAVVHRHGIHTIIRNELTRYA